MNLAPSQNYCIGKALTSADATISGGHMLSQRRITASPDATTPPGAIACGECASRPLRLETAGQGDASEPGHDKAVWFGIFLLTALVVAVIAALVVVVLDGTGLQAASAAAAAFVAVLTLAMTAYHFFGR